MKIHNIVVAMSTYNGELYIQEQIDSILEQKNVKVDLFVRDDDSKDKTLEILKTYAKKRNNIHFIKGENLGVGNSFMELLYSIGCQYDYYAFADQDDVWLPDKLNQGIAKIKGSNTPLLYVSNQILVDKDLNRLKMRFEVPPGISYKQILCQNQVSGCTMIWNKELQKLLIGGNRRPSKGLLKNRIHDVWVAMVASVAGKIIYDANSYILYRQHENNVVGVKKNSIIKQWMKKLKDDSQRNGRSKLCKEIYEKFGDIMFDEECKRKLDIYGNYRNEWHKKIELFQDSDLTNYTGESEFGLKMKILLNLF